ncbi:glutathione S-transferase family protein [Archangium lipolyticum]|uniref:glutathione S-transferase family protein n=1 Tax=Archangium lipolyticum TaxID=2970465 RepID=UPI00214A178C|nr:glutathione S-transferase family protein [Archangium lipolyticum]
MITVTAFRWVPPFAQGLVRDLRVRWALEEAGRSYQERLIGPEDQTSEAYRRLQPFGQVPVYEEDGLTLFESGAIVLHIAESSQVLMPSEPAARARTITWMFAALNSIEPHIQNLATIDLFSANEEWAKLRRPGALKMVEKKLDELVTWLDGREWLEDRFTAGDLLMTSVLRILRHTELVTARQALEAYRLRGEARPAFQKALADQLAPFAKNAPPRA